MKHRTIGFPQEFLKCYNKLRREYLLYYSLKSLKPNCWRTGTFGTTLHIGALRGAQYFPTSYYAQNLQEEISATLLNLAVFSTALFTTYHLKNTKTCF